MEHYKRLLLAATASCLLSACATRPLSHVSDDPRYDALTSDKLTPFASETAYEDWRHKADSLEKKRQKEQRAQKGGNDEEDYIIVSGSRIVTSPNITNVQNIGVDEGDIVKQVGDHLVLLQDGRLFSLSIAGSRPTLAARIDLYDDIDDDIWYDELLVSGRRLVVTGYHYGKNATEISVFDLDNTGQFTRQGVWYLESDDYYSSDNSATRMIGDTLIFHTEGDIDSPDAWPALRRKGQNQTTSILNAQNIHPPLLRLDYPSLHMVTECKLAQDLTCKSRGVIAASRAEWVVTENDGFLWVEAPTPNWYVKKKLGVQNRTQPATLYRFPIGSNQVEAVNLDAKLNSRFSFEVRKDQIFALVSQNDQKADSSNLAFLNMPMSAFAPTPTRLTQADFTPLPGQWSYYNKVRFTEDHLIYSNGSDDKNIAYVMDLNTQLSPSPVTVPHEINRLDRVGRNAVLIGEGTDYLGISWLDLKAAPTLTDTLEMKNRFEAGGRAQALNMTVKPNETALLGLPTYFDDTSSGGWDFDEEEDGTDISFARISSFGQLSNLGPAQGDPSRVDPNYICETSCVDWYGNARPFFIGDRIFALIASELIELEETPSGIIERARINLSAPL